MSAVDNIRQAAEMRAAVQAANRPDLPDYAGIADSFRRNTILDRVPGLTQIAACDYRLGLRAPQRPTFSGRLLAITGRLLEPILWRLLRALNADNPFQAMYDALLHQQELEAQREGRFEAELDRLRKRVDSIEATGRHMPPQPGTRVELKD